MFRWGILSTAKIGREQVIPAIASSENGCVYGIASRDLAKAETLAKSCGAPHSYGSYEALIADENVDGVYIPLHTSGHIEWSIKAAKAGKHVLCEKPIAMEAGEIDELIALRDSKGLVISEAFMVNYHPQWHKVRALIADGQIGELHHVQGAFTYHLVDETNMRNQPELGGGGLRDIGVYPVVTTRIVAGKEPKRLRSTVDYDPKFKTDRFARVEAEFDGFSLDFYCATQLAPRQSMVFHGSKGLITLDAPFNPGIYDQSRVRVFDGIHRLEEVFGFGDVNQYTLQCEEFVRATKGKGEVFSLENSRANQRVIDACFEAGATESWVNL